MIPYKDENPTHHIPWVTYAIVFANFASWILVQGWGNEPTLSQAICRFGVVPGALTGAETVTQANNYCQVAEQSPQVWVTAMFMHGDWIHLLGNMWFLWMFADNIEDVLRPLKFIVFYLVGGLSAMGAQVLVDPGSMVPVVGASGAIGGVMGAYIWLYPHIRVRLAMVLGFYIFGRTVTAGTMLGIWLVIQLIGAILSYFSGTYATVAFWAHIAGFLCGFFLIQLLYLPGTKHGN